MFIGPLLTILFIIWIISYVVNPKHNNYNYNCDNTCNSNKGYSLDRSLGILNERYARGEITEEEFQRIKGNLEK